MDNRLIRALRLYDHNCSEESIYIDKDTMDSLSVVEGDIIILNGRRKDKAVVKELNPFDHGAQIGRVSEKILRNIMIEYGEEILLEKEQ